MPLSIDKIVARDVLKTRLEDARATGKIIVFTNGCFDILHAGHVSYLEKAKQQGQLLVVGLNSDQSVRCIKGPQRPIVHQDERAQVLAGLEAIDYVTLFDEETPYALIEYVLPDVLVKGADWQGKVVAGEDIVQAHGGRVVLIDFVEGCSSTSIIERVLKKSVL